MRNTGIKKKKVNRKNLTPSERNLGTFQKSKDIATVYVGNLRYTVKENAIKRMFERYGEVSYVRLIVDPKTQMSKGIAFIQMPDKQKANNAITSINGREINGRTLKVSIAKDNDSPQPFIAKPKEEPKEIKPIQKRQRKIDFTTLFQKK